ncbi:hypothetical protein B0H10DRAFT_1943718 [Mycena sp. CBHHK59/15]|nr:hypothetical protein B0H10DRAFT_1943718 [Mycena sp. CBHHK59/15]
MSIYAPPDVKLEKESTPGVAEVSGSSWRDLDAGTAGHQIRPAEDPGCLGCLVPVLASLGLLRSWLSQLASCSLVSTVNVNRLDMYRGIEIYQVLGLAISQSLGQIRNKSLNLEVIKASVSVIMNNAATFRIPQPIIEALFGLLRSNEYEGNRSKDGTDPAPPLPFHLLCSWIVFLGLLSGHDDVLGWPGSHSDAPDCGCGHDGAVDSMSSYSGTAGWMSSRSGVRGYGSGRGDMGGWMGSGLGSRREMVPMKACFLTGVELSDQLRMGGMIIGQ